jgi:hypothetical protein
MHDTKSGQVNFLIHASSSEPVGTLASLREVSPIFIIEFDLFSVNSACRAVALAKAGGSVRD